ncbi:MAG: hypothetical protein HN341_02105 [Verrucomicrobia bacterium]|nr:hypothetical protein [Verrucomicrobiota bacterium]
MKNEVVLHSASYLTPEGFGNSSSGSRQWPGEDGAPADPMDLAGISWSSLFDSPCPRFGRMDLLSRLGLMAVELLGVDFAARSDDERRETGVALLTPTGSLSTDLAFLRDISPSTFVYTLPSSVVGEMCIRHRLQGPQLCLTSGSSGGRTILDEAAERIHLGEARAMLCLACEARSADAVEALDFALAKPSPFCWDVYALYLVQGAGGETPKEKTVGAGVEVRAACLDLCKAGE